MGGPIDSVYHDGSPVAKTDVRADDKAGHRRTMASVDAVHAADLTGQFGGIYVASIMTFFDIDTENIDEDDGENVIIDNAGNHFIKLELGSRLPSGGTAGQILAKVDGSDFNVEWVDQSGGASSLVGPYLSIVDDDDNEVLRIKSDVLGTGLPGIEGQDFFIYKHDTAPDPKTTSTFRVQRDVDYTSGNPDHSTPTIWGLTDVRLGTVDSHYAGLFALQNYSADGQQVGGAFVGNKMGTGHTFGGWTIANDKTHVANPVGVLCTHEFDNAANGTDDNNQRVIVGLFGLRDDPAGTKNTIAYALSIKPFNDDDAEAHFKNGIYFKGTYDNGINFSDSTSMTSAIHLKDGYKIHFDTVANHGLYFESGSLKYEASGTDVLSVLGDGQLYLAGAAHAPGFEATGSTAPPNGMFLSAANVLGLSANSNQKVWVSADGVGIGAATVSSIPLQVTHPSSAQFRLVTTAGANVDFRLYASDGGVGAGAAIFGTYSNDPFVLFVNASETARLTTAAINLASGKVLQVNGTKVVGARDTGWTAWTGTGSKATKAVGTATAADCAAAIKSMLDAMITHGLIGT